MARKLKDGKTASVVARGPLRWTGTLDVESEPGGKGTLDTWKGSLRHVER